MLIIAQIDSPQRPTPPAFSTYSPTVTACPRRHAACNLRLPPRWGIGRQPCTTHSGTERLSFRCSCWAGAAGVNRATDGRLTQARQHARRERKSARGRAGRPARLMALRGRSTTALAAAVLQQRVRAATPWSAHLATTGVTAQNPGWHAARLRAAAGRPQTPASLAALMRLPAVIPASPVPDAAWRPR